MKYYLRVLVFFSSCALDWYATPNSMELSDYAKSGTWSLLDAPAEMRIVRSPEPPYTAHTEIVFFMSMKRQKKK